MKQLGRVSLRAFNTFGCEAHAAHVVQLEQDPDVEKLEERALDTSNDLVLGGGSNILLLRDVPGTVYLMRLKGRRIVDEARDSVLVDAAAGESWHDFVNWTLEQGCSGLENLSLIPGLVGAAPMQNIGAYGVELADRLESVLARDWHSGEVRRIDHHDCRFRYRDSRFKSDEPDRWLILSCRLRLDRRFRPRIQYAGVGEELAAMGVTEPTARDVADAVIRLRNRKLPNPEQIGNAGSFFKNPVVPESTAWDLAERYPAIPVYPAGRETAKLSAAWLIEHCGWKGRRRGDAGVSEQHALVLVNHGMAQARDILDLATEVARSVEERFGISLEPEPRLYGLEDHERW